MRLPKFPDNDSGTELTEVRAFWRDVGSFDVFPFEVFADRKEKPTAGELRWVL